MLVRPLVLLVVSVGACLPRYPASEVCNGLDDDGDGEVDEDAADGIELYRDEDEDGVGAGSPTLGCPRPGRTWTSGDCDDLDPSTFPGADERCDGRDQDCDGLPSPLEIDADGDGFFPCQGDCDDDDPATYPGAKELCDLIDQDCSGSVDDEHDNDEDGFAPCAGDCDDTNPKVAPGEDEACDGIDNDCDGSVDGGWDVPGRFPTPQAAVDRAVRNALVCIGPGEWPAFSVPRPMRVEGYGTDQTVITLTPGVTMDLTVDGGVELFNLTLRRDPSDRPGAPMIHLAGGRWQNVRVELGDCPPRGWCTGEVIRQAKETTWDRVDLGFGTLEGTTLRPLVWAEGILNWESGAIREVTIRPRPCGDGATLDGLVEGPHLAALNVPRLAIVDLHLDLCELTTLSTLEVVPRGTQVLLERIRFTGGSGGPVYALTGAVGEVTLRDTVLPATPSAVWLRGAKRAIAEGVIVQGGSLFTQRYLSSYEAREVHLEPGARLLTGELIGSFVSEIDLVNVTSSGPLMYNIVRVEELTAEGGQWGGLIDDPRPVSLSGIDLRGVTLDGPLVTSPSVLATGMTLAGIHAGDPLFQTGELRWSFATVVGSQLSGVTEATAGQIAHTVFAFNTGEGDLPATVRATYVHRHEDATAVWSPLTATALTYGDPLFLDVSGTQPAEWDLRPGPGSPLIDVGPDGCKDPDGTPCDIGSAAR